MPSEVRVLAIPRAVAALPTATIKLRTLGRRVDSGSGLPRNKGKPGGNGDKGVRGFWVSSGNTTPRARGSTTRAEEHATPPARGNRTTATLPSPRRCPRCKQWALVPGEASTRLPGGGALPLEGAG